MRQEFPYRQCVTCRSIEDCHNVDVDIYGKPTPPDDCIRKKEVYEEINKYYEHEDRNIKKI